jgi:hypothetical protein
MRRTGLERTSRAPPRAVAPTCCKDERQAERDGQGTADDERDVQRDEAEQHARRDAGERADVVGLLAPQVHPSKVAVRVLVSDPGLQRTADERVPDPPQSLGGEHGRKPRDGTLERES